MPLFDAKTLDNDLDGLSLLAAVLHSSPKARDEARERGHQRLARAGTFAEVMTTGGSTRAKAKSASVA